MEVRSIARARESEEDCQIVGEVGLISYVGEGHSGVITDRKDFIPFYFDNDDIPDWEQVGLAAVLLKDAERAQAPLTLEGAFNLETKVFRVKSMRYDYAGEAYTVGDMDENEEES